MRNFLKLLMTIAICHNDLTAQVTMANSARDITNNYFVVGKRFGSNLQQLAECSQTNTDDVYVCEDLYVAMNYSTQNVTPFFTYDYNGATYNLDIFRWRVDVFLYPNGTTPLTSYYFPNDGTSYPFTFRIDQPGYYGILLAAEIDGDNDGVFVPTSPVTPTSDFNGIFCVEVNSAGNVVPSLAEVNIQNHPSLEFTTTPNTAPCIDKTICFSTDADALTMQQYSYSLHYNTSGNPDDISIDNIICSNDCQQNFCYNFPDYGNYSMFMLSGTGFCYHELDVSVHPNLSSTVEPSVVSDCSNTSTVTQVSAVTTQGYPPYTYNWSNSAGIIGNQSNASLFMSNILEGVYEVTVTDNLGCQSIASFEVQANICCVNNSDYTISNISATELAIEKPFLFVDPFAIPLVLEPSPTNVDFTINNEFIVDKDLVINFANLQMGEDAHVTVLNGVSLTINQVTISSCGNMCQGITVLDGGSLEILNSNVADALLAVDIQANATYRFENSTFDNNLNGIFISGNANGNINDCQFTNSSGTLLPPHAGETSNKGIEVWANDGIDIGPGNVFDGLKTGISLWLTNATVTECTFQNLVTEPLNPLNTGIGIYAQGDLGIPGYTPSFTNYTLDVYGMGKDAATPNFSNLRTGIMLRNMSTKEIANNFMNGVAYGVRAQLCHGGNLNINENRFANVSNTGVLFTNNLGAEILIANNNLSGQKNSINPTGVHIAGFSGDASNLLIGLNRFDRFTYGVRMNKVTGDGMDIGSQGAHIWNNDFYSTLSSSANNIHLTACERISISENYIEGAPASTNVNPNSASGITNAKHNGVYLQSTANYWLRCNNFDNLSSAVYSFGSNPTGKDNITTNQMHRHYYGWNLRKFGLDGEVGPVGAQLTSNRNDFNEAPFNYTGQRVIYGYNNTSFQPYPIYVLQNGNDGVEGINVLNGIGSNNGNVPFFPPLVNAQVDNCYAVPEGDLQMLIDDETYYEETQAIEAINGYLAQTADPMFQEVVDFEAKRKVYRAIEQDTTLLQSSSTFTNFFNQARFQTIGKLNEIENELALLSDSTVLQDSVQVAAIRQSIRTKRESIVNYSMHETNEKEVLALYEEKVLNASDMFTAAEQQFIAGLAHQCPLVAGNGVYLARSLYSLFAEDNEFNDQTICDGYYKKEKQEQKWDDLLTTPTILIYPNPASQALRLNYFVPDNMGDEAVVRVTNVTGQVIKSIPLQQGSGVQIMDVSNFSVGLYFVELRIGDDLISTTKLSVTR